MSISSVKVDEHWQKEVRNIGVANIKLDIDECSLAIENIQKKVESQEKFWLMFGENLLTQEETSNLLGISRVTLWRWETQIIQLNEPLKIQYFSQEIMILRRAYLDNYQRFILWLIWMLKSGKSGYLPITNEGVKQVLMYGFKRSKRDSFENWINSLKGEKRWAC